MAKKQCFKCLIVKPLEDFYKHPKMADGRVGKCKECNKKDVRLNYKANINHFKKYDSNRAMSEHRVLARVEYQKTPAGKRSMLKAKEKWRERNPKKQWCSRAVQNAVRSGKIDKPSTCSVCGKNGRIHGHHDDYDSAFSVRWLCPACHISWHRRNGEGKNS